MAPNPNQMTFAEFTKRQAEKDPLYPSDDHNHDSDQEDDHDNHQQRQSFYVGGKHSGQMVEGPRKTEKEGDDNVGGPSSTPRNGNKKSGGGITGLIQNIFGKAKPASDLPHDPDFEEKDEKVLFKGTAHTLSGETIKDKVKQEMRDGGRDGQSSDRSVQRRLITFWSNGFSIDFLDDQAQHGPPVFYSYDHTEANRILQNIQRG